VTVRASKYLLLKNGSDLESDEQLKEILNHSICLKICRVERGVRDIYESKNESSQTNQIKKWLETAQVFYGEAVSTIRNHFEGICNYFISRSVESWKD